jgi:hypothetical protein
MRSSPPALAGFSGRARWRVSPNTQFWATPYGIDDEQARFDSITRDWYRVNRLRGQRQQLIRLERIALLYWLTHRQGDLADHWRRAGQYRWTGRADARQNDLKRPTNVILHPRFSPGGDTRRGVRVLQPGRQRGDNRESALCSLYGSVPRLFGNQAQSASVAVADLLMAADLARFKY